MGVARTRPVYPAGLPVFPDATIKPPPGEAFMLSVSEAQAVVLQHAQPLPAEAVSTADALGLALAEDVASDLDMPPYDKAMMDGFAVRSADVPAGRGVLTVIEEVVAGQMPQQPVGAGQATRIMTGAPLPAGADAVIKIERTKLVDD